MGALRRHSEVGPVVFHRAPHKWCVPTLRHGTVWAGNHRRCGVETAPTCNSPSPRCGSMRGGSLSGRRSWGIALRGPIRTFQNPGGSLLRLHDVIVFGRESVRPPRFNSQTFRFGVAVAREKLIHFHLKCHFSLPFLFLGLSDGRRKARDKVPARSYIGGAGAVASSPRGFFRWVRADLVPAGFSLRARSRGLVRER